MNAGTFLLAAGIVTGLAHVALAMAPRLREAAWARLAATRALAAHAAAALAALGVMLVSFLVSDLSIHYVWDHTRGDYAFWYKLAGLWAGQDGTVLLWGSCVALFAFLVSRGRGEAHARARVALVALATTLLTIALSGDAFRATSASDLARAPDGAGLADVLLTPLMVIHPPIQFVAYALAAVPAAFALASWTGAADWLAPAYRWARAAWLFATVGLGLGALWAYYVLSFGGYWAWDPVETSNLLPWLALTTFLHAGKHHARFGDHALAAPLTAFAAFALTVFATFATRSGLWASVHAFTDPAATFEPDAAARLLDILAVHAPTRAFLALFTAALFGALALFLGHHAPTLPAAARVTARAHAVLLAAAAGLAAFDVQALYGLLFTTARATGLGVPAGMGALVAFAIGLPPALVYLARDIDARAERGLGPRRLMAVAVALFGVATVVAFLLNLQVVNGQDRAIFDARAPLVALPLVATLTVMLGLAPLGRRSALALAASGLALGAAGFFSLPEHRVAALVVPPLAAALVATIAKLLHVQGATAPRRLRTAGGLLLASGILGVVMWSNPPTRILDMPVPESAPVPLVGAALVLGTLAILGAIACLRARGRRLGIAGAIAGLLLAGYGIGALLALAALALLVTHRAPFAPGAGFARLEAPRLREAGIYLVHLGLLVGLLGYAASTYSQESATFTDITPGMPLVVGDHEIRVPEAAPGLILVSDVLRDGVPIDTVPLGLVEDHGLLEPATVVRRTLFADVYVQTLAIHTEADGWVGAPRDHLDGDRIDALTVRVAILPLATLVWAGLALMALGMGFVLVATRLAPDFKDARVRDEGAATKRLGHDTNVEKEDPFSPV